MEESKIAMKLEAETKDLTHICERLTEAIKHELDNGIENVNTEEMGEAVDMLKDLYEAKEKMVKACYYKQLMEAMEEEAGGEEDGMMEDDMRRGYRGQPRDSMGRYTSRRRGGRGRGGRRGYEDEMYYPMTPEMYRQMPIEWDRDMDREGMGKMYYTDGGSGSSMGGRSVGQSGSGSGMSGGNMGGSSSGTRGYEDNRGGNYGGNEGNRGGNSRYENARRGYEEKKTMGADKQEKMKSLEEYMKTIAEELTQAVEGASPEERTMIKAKLNTVAAKM